MPLYRFCGRVIASDLPLSLPPAPDEPIAYRFRVLPEILDLTPPPRPFLQHQLADGTVWVLFAHQPDGGYRCHFPAYADFALSADARDIACTPRPGLPPHTLEHLLLDQVLPRLLSHAGHTVLHASAVQVAGRGVVFLGDAGWGKSTLTTSLCRAGHPLITDDCLLLLDDPDGGVHGLGSYPGVRLWPDSVLALGEGARQVGTVSHYSSKRRIDIVHTPDPVPLIHLYLLASPDENRAVDTVHIDPIAPREAVIRLLEHSFRLDTTDRARAAHEFAALARLVERVPLFRLRYPRRYDHLPSVQQAIHTHVQAVRPPTR